MIGAVSTNRAHDREDYSRARRLARRRDFTQEFKVKTLALHPHQTNSLKLLKLSFNSRLGLKLRFSRL